MEKIKLMANYVAVEIADEKITASGIILADTVEREKPQTGKITHVGGKSSKFSVGDVVLFEKYGAIKLEISGQTLHIIDKRDIIGTLEQ